MVNKDDRQSLLAKMAKFVRNPTKDWSELDQADQPQESGYDKQALKVMIERKRQNDFVRRREFDQLRKLRNKDPAAIAGLARPSFFQTSTTADHDAKASTLKKIDDIEAQMSKQWWKGKEEATPSTQSGALATPNKLAGDTENVDRHHLDSRGIDSDSHQFQATEVASIKLDSEPFDQDAIITQMASGGPGEARQPPLRTSQASLESKQSLQGDHGLTPSSLFAVPSEDMATDPELEEAAIRFANRDDTGAEHGLLQALRGPGVPAQVGWPWAAALLDLYRATNRRDAFDSALREFGVYFESRPPQWIFLGDAQPSSTTKAADSQAEAVIPLWDCPEALNAQAMEALREVLSTRPMPWHIGWSKLKVISSDALPLLEALFHSLCEEPVVLRFSGALALVKQLREMTPANDRNVNFTWWHVRLTALRSMRLQDEFELAALQYCVTYGTSPVAWQDARCIFEASEFNELTANPDGNAMEQPATQAMGATALDALPLELRGELLGDASQYLSQIDSVSESSGPIVVSCAALVRVDFAAAGNILNWVAMRQSQGRQVQFRDVHRLVASFFGVIGIQEHARVVPRPI
jgi:anti-anti-sigma regulatory factor